MGGGRSNDANPAWRVDTGLLLFLAAHVPFLLSNASRLFWEDNIVLTSVGIIPGLWGVFEWARATRHIGSAHPAAKMFLVAAISYLCGVSTYAVLEFANISAKYPSAADIFFLLVPIFLVSGVLWLRPQGVRSGFRALQAADLILVAAATTILAAVSVAPSLSQSGETFLYLATTLAYWVVSFAAAGFTLLALLSFQWRERTPLVLLLAATLTVFTAGVLPYSYDLIASVYRPGVWYEVFWYTTPCLMAVAGRAFGKAGAAAASAAPSIPLRSPRALPTLIVGGTIIVLGLGMAKTLGGVPGDFVLAASVLTAIAVGLRERAIKLIEFDLEGRLQAALERARENELRFKHFAQSSSDFFVETDADLIITRVTSGDGGGPISQPEWLEGRHLIAHGLDGVVERDPPLDRVRRSLDAHEFFKDFEYSCEGPAGKLWRRYSGTPAFDLEGKFMGYRMAIRDITAQKHLQHENDKRAADFARVVRALDSVQEAIVILDRFNRITYLNAATDTLRATVDAHAAVGQTFDEGFPNLSAPDSRLIDDIKAGLDELGAWGREHLVELAEGRRAHFDIRAAALTDGGMIIAASDITERKHRERSESILTRKLAEAQKSEAIGKLAGSIAHDFNNIVAAIRSFASLIVFDLPDDHPDRTFAQRIVGASDRAAELVKQILLFARAGNAEREPISLKTVLDELHHTVGPTLPGHVSITVVRPETEAVIEGNAAQLLQVFMNLCLNAADAIPQAGGTIRVACDRIVLTPAQVKGMNIGWMELIGEGDPQTRPARFVSNALVPGQSYFRVTVTDEGTGIPEAVRPRLFDPFFTTKAEAKGTGLGLPIVKNIADAHNAVIVISTSEKMGTQFQICFPVSTAPLRNAPALARDAGSFTGKESVLIVDDEIDVADGLAFALQRFGYEAASVYGPEEALEAIGADPKAWDIVVTDQVMPKMRGMQLVSKLKEINQDLDIILCTGFSDTATEQKAFEAGASAFFFKPVASEVIAEAIRRLRGRRA